MEKAARGLIFSNLVSFSNNLVFVVLFMLFTICPVYRCPCFPFVII